MANPMTLSRLQSIVGMSSLKNDFVLRIGKDGDGIEVLPDPKGAGLKGWENQAIRQAVLDSLSTSEGRKNMALHFSAAKHEQVFSAFLTSKENCGKNLTVGDVRALLNTLESVQKLDEVNASYYDKQSPVRTRQVQKVDKPAYMKQAPGWNTCWLFSVLNAMQSTPAGRKYCRQIITDRTLTFYDDQFKPHQYKNWKKAPSKFRGMSNA